MIDKLAIADRVVIQAFHPSQSRSLIASTRQEAEEIKQKYAWWYEGNILAKDLVKAAVNGDKLPSQLLNDQNYLSAVNLQLNTLPDYAAAD